MPDRPPDLALIDPTAQDAWVWFHASGSCHRHPAVVGTGPDHTVRIGRTPVEFLAQPDRVDAPAEALALLLTAASRGSAPDSELVLATWRSSEPFGFVALDGQVRLASRTVCPLAITLRPDPGRPPTPVWPVTPMEALMAILASYPAIDTEDRPPQPGALLTVPVQRTG